MRRLSGSGGGSGPIRSSGAGDGKKRSRKACGPVSCLPLFLPSPSFISPWGRWWVYLYQAWLHPDPAATNFALSQLVLVLPVVIAGHRFLYHRVLLIFSARAPNMDSLIGIGTSAAFIYGCLCGIPDYVPAIPNMPMNCILKAPGYYYPHYAG